MGIVAPLLECSKIASIWILTFYFILFLACFVHLLLPNLVFFVSVTWESIILNFYLVGCVYAQVVFFILDIYVAGRSILHTRPLQCLCLLCINFQTWALSGKITTQNDPYPEFESYKMSSLRYPLSLFIIFFLPRLPGACGPSCSAPTPLGREERNGQKERTAFVLELRIAYWRNGRWFKSCWCALFDWFYTVLPIQ